MTETQQDQLNRALFGRDLATVETLPGQDLGRDLALTASGARDLAVVTGLDNLGQSLTLALTTRRGDDVFDTGYGFDGLGALADEIDPVLQRERIRVGVVSVLQRDSRVRQITDVTLSGDVFAQSRTLAVTVGFRTIAWTQVSVSLGPVVSNG
jgi:phage baseplate assembly protein W